MTARALLLAAAAVVFLAAPAVAQQPAPEGKHTDETPTLTTDDVAPAPVAGQPAGAQTEAPAAADDSALTPEERADAAKAKAKGGPSKAPAGKKGPSQAELNWRARYAQAESQMRATRERAQQAELQVTELKNQLSAAGSVEERNSLADSIAQQGEVVRQAQQAATAAAAAFKEIQAEGTTKRFTLAAGPAPTTSGGRANPDYYRQQYVQAQQDLDDAERRLKLYQDRISDARARILNNSGSGDNYAQMGLQEELDAALAELDKAQADRDAAEQRRDAARDAAIRAGIALPQP